MRICVAQLHSLKGNISANISAHKNLIAVAASFTADAVFFPELSLTGYEPSLAENLATTQDDTRFEVFQQWSDELKLTIGVGMPVRLQTGAQIGLLIFQPSQLLQTYCKQILHEDELPYFVAGRGQLIVDINGEKVAPAICYESLQAAHVEQAVGLGARLYVTSVAKSQNGLEKAIRHFPTIAEKYQMPVLMANSVGPCDNFLSVGSSAVWNNRGQLVGQLDNKSEGLLLFDTATEEVAITYLRK